MIDLELATLPVDLMDEEVKFVPAVRACISVMVLG